MKPTASLWSLCLGLGLAVFVAACATKPKPPAVVPPPSGIAFVNQGDRWTVSARNAFYWKDQGSRMIPLAWITALKQANGHPFLEDSLSRYGYLPDSGGPTPGLPVGFVAANEKGTPYLGMTCAACHTRQIDVDGRSYRIDGGPAIVDFESFLRDLDNAVEKVATNPAAFNEFAAGVLGPTPDPGRKAELQAAVTAWQTPFHAIVKGSLPTDKTLWGPARLDAVSMIFNRVAGLDIGPPPTYLIEDNIAAANAPVRYPFLWNAAIQDMTQWPGFAANGNDLLGLSRNLGEVMGVFGIFHPKKDPARRITRVDFLADNSANFDGLGQLENLIKEIGAPKWPWPVDLALAAKGRPIYDRACGVNCHEETQGKVRLPNLKTWRTPLIDVGTDSREHAILKRTGKPGVLAASPFLAKPKKGETSVPVFDLLTLSVAGSIFDRIVPIPFLSVQQDHSHSLKASNGLVAEQTAKFKELASVFQRPATTTGPYPYEARVLKGIWAAAPYLHNGSVPNMVELLKPANERVRSFAVGPAYDPVTMGLAARQDKFGYTLATTDCNDRDSGNSRCGHSYGADLSDADKKALLEYLKTL